MIDTTLVRALAALLIANSHLEDFYPIRLLAADGLLGDSLFFLLSGLGLALSERRVQRGFWSWYGRRLARIVPSVFLAVLFFDAGLKGGWLHWTLSDYALNLLWARPYPFIGQILVYYVFYFMILRFGDRRLLGALIIGLFLPLGVLPLTGRSAASFHLFHWLFYFQVMLLGGWLGRRQTWLTPGGWRDLLGLLTLVPLYVGLRWASASGRLASWFFLPYLLVMPIDVLLVRLCQAERLLAAIRRWQPVDWLVTTVAAVTLEVYLAHYQFLTSHTIASLTFPLNVVLFFAASLALAVAIATVGGWLRAAVRSIVGLGEAGNLGARNLIVPKSEASPLECISDRK
ncbi:MAG TPA: acyltransferase family protein [Isosphaeraceae bacterium]|jgi:hypothetical protein|nr:acyltransferase family protein [Isosphaeraceae bacterium]